MKRIHLDVEFYKFLFAIVFCNFIASCRNDFLHCR